jgi:hypothetical protein
MKMDLDCFVDRQAAVIDLLREMKLNAASRKDLKSSLLGVSAEVALMLQEIEDDEDEDEDDWYDDEGEYLDDDEDDEEECW